MIRGADIALAAHFFPRLVPLDGGRIVADGPPALALAPERVRATFGVDPAIFGARAPIGPTTPELTVGTGGR